MLLTFSQRLATDSAPQPAKKKHVFRRVVWTTVALTGSFYVGSTFVSFNFQTYYDFFSDHVPLGQSMLDFAETRGWDTITMADVVNAGSNAVVTTSRLVQRAFGKVEETKQEPTTRPTAVVRPADALRIQTLPPTSSKPSDEVQPQKKAAVQDKKPSFPSDVQELVNKAEAALEKHVEAPTPLSPAQAPAESKDTNVYDVPLPVGFEPPPGYRRPLPPSHSKEEPKTSEPDPKPEPEPTPVQLPLVTPVVSALNEAEPIITHLAGTIDNLASFVATNPAAALKATDVLEEAKSELTSLVERIEKIKEEERAALEAKMDEQTREYSVKLIEIEMEVQDKLDSQEEGYKKIFEEERAKMIEAYREKLEQELKIQTELINER